MKCICPECKNDIDVSVYPDLAVGTVIECPTCGIVLHVTNIAATQEGEPAIVSTEIVDEGK